MTLEWACSWSSPLQAARTMLIDSVLPAAASRSSGDAADADVTSSLPLGFETGGGCARDVHANPFGEAQRRWDACAQGTQGY